MERMKPEINKIHQGDSLQVLRSWPDSFIQTVVTSPPYWGLRDYGVEGQIGQEKTPQEYVSTLVELFSEVRRVLKDDGTLWLNLGDTYAGGHSGRADSGDAGRFAGPRIETKQRKVPEGLKPKDLVGIPWEVAIALRRDGWYFRSDIIWAKKNVMPESVTDRPTRAHEYIFLLTKNRTYYYDQEAIKEKSIWDVDGTGTQARLERAEENHKAMPTESRNGIRPRPFFKDAEGFNGKHKDKQRGHSRRHAGFNDRWDHMSKEEQCSGLRNRRDVWTVATAQFPEAHFATFPEELIEPCILAGSRAGGGDIVLDPFMGAGTTALVSSRLNRSFLGIELNPEYIKIAEKRISNELSQQKMAI